MARRIGFLTLLGLAVTATSARAQGYGYGGLGYTGFGYPGFGSYGYGFGGYGLPFATFPFPDGGFIGNGYSGPGSLNPLLGLGLTPLAVQSALGEASLGRVGSGVLRQVPTIVTVPASGSRTYTYRIYRQ